LKPHVLVARLDNAGDVLLAGPAVRAVAAGTRRVTMLCGPQGEAAAELLPGVDEVLVYDAPWVAFEPGPLDREETLALVDEVSSLKPDQAIIFTSFHQSPLPLALLLRMAGVPFIAATSVDYPGSLLDVRHRIIEDIHEVERSLDLVGTVGYGLSPGDGGSLAVRRSGEGLGAGAIRRPRGRSRRRGASRRRHRRSRREGTHVPGGGTAAPGGP